MSAMGTVAVVLASLLPFALIGLGVVLFLRWPKQPGETPPLASLGDWSRTRSVAFLIAIVVVSAAVTGAVGGWTLESLLMPVGWLVTPLLILLVDGFLDRRLHGKRPKVVGPVPFWWVFVWVAAAGWGVGSLSSDSPWPTWASLVVLGSLLLAAVVAFCFRFGLRFGR